MGELFQNHHVVIDDPDLRADILRETGIDIDTWAPNRINLPTQQNLADALIVPLHVSRHDYTEYSR